MEGVNGGDGSSDSFSPAALNALHAHYFVIQQVRGMDVAMMSCDGGERHPCRETFFAACCHCSRLAVTCSWLAAVLHLLLSSCFSFKHNYFPVCFTARGGWGNPGAPCPGLIKHIVA